MQTLLEIVIGIIVASGFVLLVGRSRKYMWILAIGLIITALIYVGLGLFSGSLTWVMIELAGVLIYAAFARLGLKKSAWFLAAGWALHPLWDAGLHDYSTEFVPHWYIAACIGFDLLVAGYVVFREVRK